MQEQSTIPFDAVIVGRGLAGLTAAAYLARGRRSVLLFEKLIQWKKRILVPQKRSTSLSLSIQK